MPVNYIIECNLNINSDVVEFSALLQKQNISDETRQHQT